MNYLDSQKQYPSKLLCLQLLPQWYIHRSVCSQDMCRYLLWQTYFLIQVLYNTKMQSYSVLTILLCIFISSPPLSRHRVRRQYMLFNTSILEIQIDTYTILLWFAFVKFKTENSCTFPYMNMSLCVNCNMYYIETRMLFVDVLKWFCHRIDLAIAKFVKLKFRSVLTPVTH